MAEKEKTRKTKSAVILCSGGLDSVVAAHYAKKKMHYKNIKIIFLNYSQNTLNKEKECSKACAKNINAEFIELKIHFPSIYALTNKKTKIKKISRMQLKNTKEESEKFYFPFRNLMFIVQVLNFIESKFKNNIDMIMGFKCEGKESYPDTTKEFIKSINKILKIHNYKGRIIAPLISQDKDEIILLGKKLGVDFRQTYSCYISKKRHCGVCLACMLRKEAFYWANVKDTTKYKNNF